MKRNEDNQKFQIEVITSDITYMKETYCVAGWNPASRQMKRLLIAGKHWDDRDLKKLEDMHHCLSMLSPLSIVATFHIRPKTHGLTRILR